MAKKHGALPAITSARATAFRVARHHLTSRVQKNPAYRAATRASIQRTLWEQRTLVKTTCMRLTLHAELSALERFLGAPCEARVRAV